VEERFKGDAGQRLLVEALQAQKIVAGNLDLAKELVGLVQLMHIKAGDTIIHQDAYDNDLYFIIAGRFRIIIKGRVTGHRGINDHVGEMAAIEPTQARSATIVADEDSVICRLSEPQLADLGKRYPDIWRNLAKELARRLAQRNALVSPVRDAIRVFIMSSAEVLDIAEQIQSNLQYANFLVEIWTNGVFKASNYPIESLEKAVDDSDFAIAIATPDDLLKARGETKPVPRDNVTFELGLFIGRLGRKRSFLVEPRGEKVKLPTDLSGLTTIGFRYGPAKDLPSLLGPVCTEIKNIINELGPRD